MTQNSRGRSFVPTRVAGRAVAAGLSAGLVASVVAFAGPAFAAAAPLADKAAGNVVTDRISGATRYDTSVAFSQRLFPTGSTAPAAIVIAAGNPVGPDALAASALVNAEGGGVVLLTQSAALPNSVVAELVRLKGLSSTAAPKVFIVGGEGVVSVDIETFLKSLFTGTNEVTRLGGQTRFGTSQLVAAQIAKDSSASDTAILTNGYGIADSLSAGPIAYAEKSPIVLTAADALPDEAKAALANFKKVLVVGGKGVVSDAVVAQAEAIVGSGNVTRIAGGTDRYETATQVADFEGRASSSVGGGLGWGFTQLVLARGDGAGPNFADALSAGVYAGVKKEPILLVAGPNAGDIPTATAKFHVDNKSTIATITAAGGAGVLSDAELGAAAKAANDTYGPAFYASLPTMWTTTAPGSTVTDYAYDVQATGSLGSGTSYIAFSAKAAGVEGNGVVVNVKGDSTSGTYAAGANVSGDGLAKATEAAATSTTPATVTVTVKVDSTGKVLASTQDVADAIADAASTTTKVPLTIATVSSLSTTPGAAVLGSVTLSGGSSTVSVSGSFDDQLLGSVGTSNFGLELKGGNYVLEVPSASSVTAVDGSNTQFVVVFKLDATTRAEYGSGTPQLYVSGVADLAGNTANGFAKAV